MLAAYCPNTSICIYNQGLPTGSVRQTLYVAETLVHICLNLTITNKVLKKTIGKINHPVLGIPAKL